MTDEDKNLLELAARAAGINYNPTVKSKRGLYCASYEDQGRTFYWNPLANNGDALWLVVKLGLTVVVESDMVFCRNQRSDKAFRESGSDRYAATRRAIVRAAADVGKGMR